jgi:hypothetical protein
MWCTGFFGSILSPLNDTNYQISFYINDIIKMKERKLPPKVKIIEALSAVADERIIIEDLLSKE